MRELHPRRQQPQIPNDSVTTGKNRENATYPESGYIRCSRCGFVMNKYRSPQGTGDGITQAETQLNGAVLLGATSITVDSTTGFSTPATGTITAFAKNGSSTKVTDASHGLKGGKVTITGTTSYNGVFYVQDVTTDTFVIQAPYVANDATGTWTVPEYIYIHDAGAYATAGDADSTYTDATGAPNMNKVSYTAIGSTTSFTGCSGTTAHDDNMYVHGEPKATGGCSMCGTFEYD